MKKNLILFILLSIFLGLTSCKKDEVAEFSYSDIDQISYAELFTKNYDAYMIVCYQANCTNCEKLKDTIEEYYHYAKEHEDARPLFAINVLLEENKDMVLATSEDPYPEDMMYTTDYNNVKIKTTPTLLVIKNGRLGKNISDYSTNYPVTETREYLNNLMNKGE